jgi:cyclic beta-1,2-glucan synthetase
VIVLNGATDTPLPWVNVIANERFGTVLGATGAAWTWAGNSRENRLTPFGNDPVSEFSGEALYLRDEDMGATWGATPGPLPRSAESGLWVTRHGAGITRYQHRAHGITSELAVFVHPREPVRLSRLSLTNDSAVARRLSVFVYHEWALCPPRAGEHRFVTTEQDGTPARCWHAIPTTPISRTAWRSHAAACRPLRRPVIGSSSLGRNGSLRRPAALGRTSLGQRFGAGLDPCAALQLRVDLEPASRAKSCSCWPGRRSRARADAGETLRQRGGRAGGRGRSRSALGHDPRHRAGRERPTIVRSGHEPLAALPVDQLAAVGPHGLLPAGGAYGFRDQLQDVMALGHARPDLYREHLLRCAARQFLEGTCSTGGIRTPVAAFARAARTTCCGCPTP